MQIGVNKKEAVDMIARNQLEKVKEETDLGVTICSNLKVGKQCRKAAYKGNQILGLINRTITCKKKMVILRLYKSLVRPHLEYCIQAWRPHLKKDIEVLERVQRRATRMMEEGKGKHYDERLKLAGLTTLETRRVRADMLEVYKILRGHEGLDEIKFFNRRQQKITRGHSMTLYKERFNRDILKFSFGNRVIEEWNRLPEEVVSAEGINSFKGKLYKLLRTRGGK